MVENKDLANEYSIFIKNIKTLRNKKNWTQEILAEKSDLSISYIKQIESCKEYKNISLTTILKLSKALNVSINELFYKKI